MNTHRLLRMVVVLLALTVAVQADWNPGDPHKMHYPQLPDPFGWDVSWVGNDPLAPTGNTLADDFLCTASGEITDIHFWVSWGHDQVEWQSIRNIHLSIHKDNPAGTVYPWSSPGELVWEGDSEVGDFDWSERFYESGQQGWYDPLNQIAEPYNHFETWQINIGNILDPFYQVEGETYWLDIRIDQDPFLLPVPFDPIRGRIGWKTSWDHWNDDAVFDAFPFDPGFNEWRELLDPFSGESLDMAFVIVPEPNAIAMIVVTSAGFIFARRRFMI